MVPFSYPFLKMISTAGEGLERKKVRVRLVIQGTVIVWLRSKNLPKSCLLRVPEVRYFSTGSNRD